MASTGPRTRKRATSSRSRVSKNTYKTRSGQNIRINRNVSERLTGWRDNLLKHKATRLAGSPKAHLKRFLYRLRPKNLYEYWFSKEGAIMALKVAGISIVALFILLVGLGAYLRKDLPAINNIYGQNLGGSISYYDRTGQVLLWQDYDAIKRVPVAGNNISPYMKQATVAIEDKNFYHEGAVSVSGIVRAGLHDVFGGSGGGLQGASTITEQLVKLNAGLNGSRTIGAKIKEVILAVELERQYSKSDILTGYLNIAPYGGVDYGVQTAAEDYFNEPASQLTLAQSAMLAAIPQAPTYYSPYSSPQFNSAATENDFGEQALITRQQYVLDQMAKQGYITTAQANAAKQVNVLAEVQPLENKYTGIIDPYFVLSAKQQLEKEYGAATVDRGGWKVITTLNVPLQNIANSLVQKNLPLVEENHGDEEAMVAESTQTGQVDALVGGVNFNNPQYGQINYAEAPIPPGSSFKPYDYSTLINDTDNVGAGSLIYDVKEPIPGYPCTTGSLQPLDGGNCLEDYDFKYPGAEELRYALAGSRNIPAVKSMLSVVPNAQCEEDILAGCVPSINKVISTADSMMDVPNAYQCYSDVGLTDPTQCYSSSAIGDGAYLTLAEHANGLATLGRMGVAIPQTFILKITDAQNKVVYNWTQPKGTQVIKPDTAYIMNNMLDDPNASYLPSSQKFQSYKGWNIAVKTGTTNNEFDALMTAWTTQYSVVSWAGYHSRNVALTAGLSEVLTEPMTRTFMQDALSMLNEKPINWTQPAGIKVLPAYQQTAHIDYGDVEPGPSTDLYPSWYQEPSGSSSSSVIIDKVSNLLATSCTPALARQTLNGQNTGKFSIDLFWPIGTTVSTNTSVPTQYDDIHQCGEAQPAISILNGNPACSGSSCTLDVSITQGAHPLSAATFPLTVNILVDGASQAANCSFSPDPTANPPPASVTGTCSFNYSPGSGTHTVVAQVVDSVLDSGKTSAINVLTITSAGSTVSWSSSDSSGSYTVSVTGAGNPTCVPSPASATSCQVNGLVSGQSYSVTVTDTNTGYTTPASTIQD
ncbi:MAG TPA: transglycosylase domain-containing protein [Candidatus Saccharimonadales bacterium]|nr:transglycosylase domain-containing protein [Candidatus Saccharimonadales bacterium]